MIGMGTRVRESWVIGVEVRDELVKATPTGKWRLTQTYGDDLIIWCEMTYTNKGLFRWGKVTEYFPESLIAIRKVIDFD